MATNSDNDRKFDAILEKLGEMAALDFSTTIPTDEEDNSLNAIAMGVNMLGQELENTVVEKTKLESTNKKLEEFVYITSHDLQEPLRTINSFTDLLATQYQGKLDDAANQYLAYISEASNRLRDLVSDLLDFGRIGQNSTLTTINMNDVVQNVVNDLNQLIEENQAKIKSEQLPELVGYRKEIHFLIQNILSNAIKFKNETPPLITISANDNMRFWQFCIEDNGIGIAKDQQQKIFQIFQRLHGKKDYDGTGIGLAHCKKITELLGGDIWVESTPKVGSKFYFTISKQLGK